MTRHETSERGLRERVTPADGGGHPVASLALERVAREPVPDSLARAVYGVRVDTDLGTAWIVNVRAATAAEARRITRHATGTLARITTEPTL